MLKSIHLEDFQAHADTTIDLASGITAILGTSNAGKTAILRGLRWVMRNRPSGSGFIRHGQQGAYVTVETTASGSVVRHRGKGGNFYVVNGEQLDALGKTVPPDVDRALGMGEINVQSQLDPVFLLLDPPGAIAAAIGDVIHLQEASAVADRLAAQVREDARATADLEARRDRLGLALKRFDRLDVYRVGVEAVIAADANVVRISGILAALADAAGRLVDADDALATLPAVPDGIDRVITLVEERDDAYYNAAGVFNSLEETADSLRSVDGLILAMPDTASVPDMIERLVARQAGAQEAARRLEDAKRAVASLRLAERQLADLPQTEALVPMAASVNMQAAVTEAASQAWLALKGFVAGLRNLDTFIGDAAADGQRADERYNSALAELDTCPACGQALDVAAKEHLLEHRAC